MIPHVALYSLYDSLFESSALNNTLNIDPPGLLQLIHLGLSFINSDLFSLLLNVELLIILFLFAAISASYFCLSLKYSFNDSLTSYTVFKVLSIIYYI